MSVNLTDCPAWPRYLTRESAAVYLGVSTDLFDDEVRQGLWPAPRRRGGRGGKLTWDRLLLDDAADRASGITHGPEVGEPVAASSPSPAEDTAATDRSRIDAAFPPKRA